jgi:uncharacterized protein (DUF58 family)
MRAPDVLLEREALERLERLSLRWSRSFSGLLGGHNVSRRAGVGHEFLDHRGFNQGDDLRSVNWRAYFRLERLFLKMFRTEPRTPVKVLLDVSESMACGGEAGAGEPKFSYGAKLVAALCYIALVRLETMVIYPFSDHLHQSFRAQGGRHRFALAADFLRGLETGGGSDFAAAIRQFAMEVRAPGLAVVVSDFLDEGDCPAALQRLASEGHELALVQIAAPEDRLPPWDGELELADAESDEMIRVQMDRDGAREYQAAFDGYCATIERVAVRNEGRYVRLDTDVPLEDALFGSLMGAGALSLQ